MIESKNRCFWKVSRFMAPLALTGLTALTACSIREPDVVRGVGHQVANIYEAPGRTSVSRVAVLPLSAENEHKNLESDLGGLERILQKELFANQLFEVVSISSDWLRRETGRSVWQVNEPIPHDLLARIMAFYRCDAVLFSHITDYHPYPPMRIGWRLKLVSALNGDLLWSADEIFDASEKPVATSARLYYQTHQWGSSANGHSRSILDSPSRFSAYAIASIVQTYGKK